MKKIETTQITKLSVVAFLMLTILSCTSDDETMEPESEICFEEFNYDDSTDEGPTSWSNYCTAANVTNQCGSTVRQSPINIVGAVGDTKLAALSRVYDESRTDILNNGHTIEFEYHGNATLNFRDTEYSLLQFHFHANSEHTIDGNSRPLEAHLVHRSDAGGLAVIGVFFEAGSENAFLAQFINDLPDTEDERYEDDALLYDASSLLPSNQNYFNYNGSLTTPPCSEIVEWIVMETSLEASQAQINAFSTLLKSNFRPVQPLNGRTISKFTE